MEPPGRPAAGDMSTQARHISVIGPGRCTADEYREAQEVGRLVAGRGAVLVCGGLGGVMAAAARGAREAGGRTIGILPGHDRHVANPYIDQVISTGLGEARNLIVVSTGDAIVAVGGGYGTLSEIGLAAKIGRPVVILRGWQLGRRPPGSADDAGEAGTDETHVRYASSPEEAVTIAFELLDRHRPKPVSPR